MKDGMNFLKAADGFLGLDDSSLAEYDSAEVVVQQLPYERTSSYVQGSKDGPAAIIQASAYVEFYDEELGNEPCRRGIATQESLDFEDLDGGQAMERIRANTTEHLSNEKFVVSLGAEHTVTYGIYKAYREKFPNMSILQIDAHADLRDSYQGDVLSHACVMARINHYAPPICQVGVRALCKEEAELIERSDNIHTFFAHQLRDPKLIDKILNSLGEDVYITVDADGFDPSVMPAAGTIEPGGLLWFDALDIFREVCKKKNVVGFDIVECAPRPGDVQTQYNLAQLAYKLIGFSLTK